MPESKINEEGGKRREEVVAWIGLDWADQKHQMVEYEVATGQTTSYEVKHSAEALQSWVGELRARYRGSKVAVVLEQARGSVLYSLMSYDFLNLYPINPASMANYRKAFHSSGAKSDPADAALMMEMVRKNTERFRVWRPEDPETRSLRLLAEGRRKQVKQVTRLTNQLTVELKNYYPQALELAGELNSWQACVFLERWSTLGDLKRASSTQLRNFYKKHGRPGEETIQKRIKLIKDAIPITEDRAVVLAGSMTVRTIVAQLKVLIEKIAEFEEQIAQLFQGHPDRFIFESFPGAGPALGPRLLAAFGADRDRWESVADIQKLSGVAPVTNQSGKSRVVTWRRACPKFMRQTFHEYAVHSVVWCDWAKAFYDSQRDRGKKQHAALRSLAFKWMRIMFSCWKTKTPYDDQVYLKSLALRGSPFFARAELVRTARDEKKKTRKTAQVPVMA